MSKPFDIARINQLADAAGPKCFARGSGYFEQGRVILLSMDKARIVAEAHGSEAYGVRIGRAGGKAEWHCGCPAFEDSGFCKHLVAVALTVNAELEEGAVDDDTGKAIADHLQTFHRDALIAQVIGLAETEPGLFRRLAYLAGAEPREDIYFD